MCTGTVRLRTGIETSSYEESNEPSGSINGNWFRNFLSDYQFLKKELRSVEIVG
jgi:hypothetical protein